MSFNPFAAGGVDVDKLPYFVLRKVQSIGTSHGFELVKIEPMRDNRETSMGRLELEDLFVRSGEIVKGTEVPEKYNPDENKTYMHLILSNDEGTEVYIDVTDLIDMPDAGKVPLDNDNTLTVEQLNLIKKSLVIILAPTQPFWILFYLLLVFLRILKFGQKMFELKMLPMAELLNFSMYLNQIKVQTKFN